jgi:hypothetical protein
MWLLILEALIALALLIGMVWWVMFAGRRRGERNSPREPVEPPTDPASEPTDKGRDPPGSDGVR